MANYLLTYVLSALDDDDERYEVESLWEDVSSDVVEAHIDMVLSRTMPKISATYPGYRTRHLRTEDVTFVDEEELTDEEVAQIYADEEGYEYGVPEVGCTFTAQGEENA